MAVATNITICVTIAFQRFSIGGSSYSTKHLVLQMSCEGAATCTFDTWMSSSSDHFMMLSKTGR